MSSGSIRELPTKSRRPLPGTRDARPQFAVHAVFGLRRELLLPAARRPPPRETRARHHLLWRHRVCVAPDEGCQTACPEIEAGWAGVPPLVIACRRRQRIKMTLSESTLLVPDCGRPRHNVCPHWRRTGDLPHTETSPSFRLPEKEWGYGILGAPQYPRQRGCRPSGLASAKRLECPGAMSPIHSWTRVSPGTIVCSSQGSELAHRSSHASRKGIFDKALAHAIVGRQNVHTGEDIVWK